MNWKPIQIEINNSVDLVVLPIQPSNGWAYVIGKFPVTNSQYEKFLISASKEEYPKIEEPSGEQLINDEWIGPFYPWKDTNYNDPLQPVVCISYREALAYSDWINKNVPDDIKLSLADPRLWNFAAFGRSFYTTNYSDWLNLTNHIHHRATMPLKVEIDSTSRTNFHGVSDLFGNVWEWCFTKSNDFLSVLGGRNRNRLNPELKGGGFYDDLSIVRPFLNSLSLEDREYTKHSDLGFRIGGVIRLELLSLDERKRVSEFNQQIKSTMENIKVYHHLNTPSFEERVFRIEEKINQIKNIKKLVSKSELKKALSSLKDFSENQQLDYESEIIIQESRLSEVEKKYRVGILQYYEVLEVQNKIAFSILQMIEEIQLNDK